MGTHTQAHRHKHTHTIRKKSDIHDHVCNLTRLQMICLIVQGRANKHVYPPYKSDGFIMNGD